MVVFLDEIVAAYSGYEGLSYLILSYELQLSSDAIVLTLNL